MNCLHFSQIAKSRAQALWMLINSKPPSLKSSEISSVCSFISPHVNSSKIKMKMFVIKLASIRNSSWFQSRNTAAKVAIIYARFHIKARYLTSNNWKPEALCFKWCKRLSPKVRIESIATLKIKNSKTGARIAQRQVM